MNLKKKFRVFKNIFPTYNVHYISLCGLSDTLCCLNGIVARISLHTMHYLQIKVTSISYALINDQGEFIYYVVKIVDFLKSTPSL